MNSVQTQINGLASWFYNNLEREGFKPDSLPEGNNNHKAVRETIDGLFGSFSKQFEIMAYSTAAILNYTDNIRNRVVPENKIIILKGLEHKISFPNICNEKLFLVFFYSMLSSCHSIRDIMNNIVKLRFSGIVIDIYNMKIRELKNALKDRNIINILNPMYDEEKETDFGTILKIRTLIHHKDFMDIFTSASPPKVLIGGKNICIDDFAECYVYEVMTKYVKSFCDEIPQ
ncbi:MAG: hypothetical protein BWY26_01013 [Elusimicrobia bacterium ADurb.Bin231]|nr:MAG: hypothetical protein BWY26_01013 [Elusimicrobia bacterium ADurb.Bin231]